MKLTEGEIRVLDHLADAWNSFCDLGMPERDADDFMRLINAAQAKIALRVARRVDPEIWRTD